MEDVATDDRKERLALTATLVAVALEAGGTLSFSDEVLMEACTDAWGWEFTHTLTDGRNVLTLVRRNP